MLVVIAIIAILAAIVTPGLSRVRQKADTAKCANNLKQIGFAVKSYLLDHDNRFPTNTARFNYGQLVTNYLPYLDNEYSLCRCPAQKDNLLNVGAYAVQVAIPNSGAWISYEFNQAQLGRRFVPNFITEPMRCAYVYDYPYNLVNDAAYLPHVGGMNVLYLDWHVAWLSVSEYTQGTPPVDFYSIGYRR
ncbi:MAG: hypothetical protein A2X46_17020 [Lentisphaerae bacterium GWF2_57_35]|nr:MAG: hypothetical protein A2X46_17020 [Lentisphaerae bacterium GWF2_57_35]